MENLVKSLQEKVFGLVSLYIRDKVYFKIVTPFCGDAYLLVVYEIGDTVESLVEKYKKLCESEKLVLQHCIK